MIRKILDLFSKKSSPLRSNNFDLLGLTQLDGLGWHDVRASLAWHYWKQVQPVNRGTSLIANEDATIPYVLRNKNDPKEVVRKFDPAIPASKVLEILNNPNVDRTGKEFRKSNMSSYIVTGETFVMMTGLTDLQEIFWVNPADVVIVSDSSHFPLKYIYNATFASFTFTRHEEDGRFRYLTADGTKELYQIIDFNPDYKIGNQRGYSRLSSVFFEIEQYLSGNLHNINSLKKGARPSGVVTCEDQLTPEQIDEMKKQIRAFYAGASNSGNVMVMSGGKSFMELALTNKDMEYTKLNGIAKSSMYETLEIPASFYDNSASSFNNKLNDRANLYIFAVIPITLRLAEEYTKAMMHRFKGGDDWFLDIIEQEIPALEQMFDESNLRKAKSGVFTINSLRERYGEEDYGPEGDVLYQPMTLVPVNPEQVDPEVVKARQKQLEKKGFSTEQIRKILHVTRHR